jgi:murein DD-endopeptidase MepM/ murein hydrolase activator NlpD
MTKKGRFLKLKAPTKLFKKTSLTLITIITASIYLTSCSTFEQESSAPITNFSNKSTESKTKAKPHKKSEILFTYSNNSNKKTTKSYKHTKSTSKKKYQKKAIKPKHNHNHYKTNNKKTINKKIKKISKNKQTTFVFQQKKSSTTNSHNTALKSSLKKNKLGWVNPAKASYKISNKIATFTGKYKQNIYASTNGTVMFAGDGVKPFNNMLIISKNKSMSTVYGNLTKISVKEGQYIKQGSLIAKMGKNSKKSGSGKLIFQIRKNGKAINPWRYL